MKCSVLLALLSIGISVSGGPTQCLRVTGHLRCPVHPERANEVYVSLTDKDDRKLYSLISITSNFIRLHLAPDDDDVMEVGYSSANGNFHLYGCASDPVGSIDPVLTIVHKCKPGEAPAKKSKGATPAPGNVWTQKITIPIQEIFLNNVWNVSVNLERPPNFGQAEMFTKSLKGVCDLR